MKQLSKLALTFFVTFLSLPAFGFASTTITSSSFLEDSAVANGGIYNLTTDGSPYIFTNGIFGNKNVTINIEPGVEIRLGNGRSFVMFNGSLNAVGTTENPIVITGDTGRYGSMLFGDGVNMVNVHMENVNISNGSNCVFFNKSKAILKNSNIENCTTQPVYINMHPGSDVLLDNIKYTRIANTSGLPSTVYLGIFTGINEINPVNIKIINSEFTYYNTERIFRITDQSGNTFDPANISIKINNNVFTGPVKDNHLFFMADPSTNNLTIDATDNYWGTPNGPYTIGAISKTDGPALPANVIFAPFKTRDPKTIMECCSSVIFIPGIQGSRLYKTRSSGSEDQLWEANLPSDVEDLYLDNNGNSIDTGIYTRDIIDKTNIGQSLGLSSFDIDIYKDTLDHLNNLKNTNNIDSYIYPYDWRLPVDSVINNGTKMGDGSSVLLQNKLREMANGSPTGKVTIMAHSMGGLLTKRFIQTLPPADQALVDKVIFVAVPHIGTTEGAVSVLAGLSLEKPYGSLINQKYTRSLAENMVTAHSLIPSAKYFENGSTPIVFKPGAVELIPQLAMYGDNINTIDEMQSFVTGADGREDADFNNIGYPNVSPGNVFSQAKDLHNNIDEYTLPAGIEVYNISGSGKSTPKAIVYDKYSFQSTDYINYRVGKTNMGDGTVVSFSANNIDTQNKYFVDLYNYNKDNNLNHDHKTITGIEPVKNLLTSIITESINQNINYVGNVPNNTVANMLTVGMHSPVDVHLYDTNGRHTGPVYVEVNGEIVRFIEENIPNSEYNEYGESKYIDAPYNANYVLKLDGYASGTFTLDIQKYSNDMPTTYEEFKDLPATDLLSSTINLIPDLSINNIVLDINGDSLPDIDAKNDGTVVDLNAPPAEEDGDEDQQEQCKKEDKKDKKEKDKKCKKEKVEKDKKQKDKKDKPKENNKKSKRWHDKNNYEHDMIYKNNKNRR